MNQDLLIGAKSIDDADAAVGLHMTLDMKIRDRKRSTPVEAIWRWSSLFLAITNGVVEYQPRGIG